MENICPGKQMYMNVHSSVRAPKMEKMPKCPSTYKCINKYPYNGVLLGHKKE